MNEQKFTQLLDYLRRMLLKVLGIAIILGLINLISPLKSDSTVVPQKTPAVTLTAAPAVVQTITPAVTPTAAPTTAPTLTLTATQTVAPTATIEVVQTTDNPSIQGKNDNIVKSLIRGEQKATATSQIRTKLFLVGKEILKQVPNVPSNSFIFYFGGAGEQKSFDSCNHIFANGMVKAYEIGCNVYSILYEYPPTRVSAHYKLYDELLDEVVKMSGNLSDCQIIIIGFSNGGTSAYLFHDYLRTRGYLSILSEKCLLMDGMGGLAYTQMCQYGNLDENIYMFCTPKRNDFAVVSNSYSAKENGYVLESKFFTYNVEHGQILRESINTWLDIIK